MESVKKLKTLLFPKILQSFLIQIKRNYCLKPLILAVFLFAQKKATEDKHFY
jgi:hypothetical protein